MELLDRYLQAVGIWLPQAQRDDILRELSENIRSQAEDREAALGRPLNQDEEAQLLKQCGHPILLAGRYRPRHQLIGPAIFPFYWLAVKIALAVTAFFWLLGFGGLIASGRPAAEIAAAPLGFLHALLPALGWVTIMFAAAELFSSRFHLAERLQRWSETWDPRTLPAVKRDRPIARTDSIKGLIFDVGLGAWAMAALYYPHLVWGKLPFRFAPVWQELVLPIAAVFLVGIVQRCINLARPAWTWLPSVARIISTLISVGIAIRLLNAREIIIAAGNMEGYDRLLAIVNSTVLITLGISITICVPLVAFLAILAVREALRSQAGKTTSGMVAG